jgi:hypothetical protein
MPGLELAEYPLPAPRQQRQIMIATASISFLVRLVSAWVEVEVAVLVATAIVAVPLEAKKPDIELWRGVIEVLFEDMKPSVLAIAAADEEGSVVRVWAGEDS